MSPNSSSNKLPLEIAQLLTKEDCAIERTLSELNEWWNVKSLELSESGLRYWHEDRSIKKFYEEIFPVKSLLNLNYSELVSSCRFLMDSTPVIDAVVSMKSGRSINVEVCQCKDGYEESARKLHLKEHGYVHGLGPVYIEGTNNKGKKISFTEMPVLHNDEILKSQRFVLNNLIKKQNKKYSSETWIVLVFQDGVLFDEDDQKNMLHFYDKEIAQYNDNYKKFFLLASSGKFCIYDDSFAGKLNAKIKN